MVIFIYFVIKLKKKESLGIYIIDDNDENGMLERRNGFGREYD